MAAGSPSGRRSSCSTSSTWSTTSRARRSWRRSPTPSVPASCRRTPSWRATSTHAVRARPLVRHRRRRRQPARGARAGAHRRPRATTPCPAPARTSSPTTCSTARKARHRIFRLVRDDGIVRIAGRDVVSLVDRLDLATPGGVRELSIELGRLGVIDALRHAGVKPGHDVAIGDERFEFSLPPEEAVGTTRRATRWTSSNGERGDAARRRARIALQSRAPRAPAALPGGDLAARPLARRARADRACRPTAPHLRNRPRCACAWRRRRPSATRR